MTDNTCILCPVLRRDDPARLPEYPPACDGCRRRLDWQLQMLPELHARLAEPEQAPYNDRWYAVLDQQGRLTGERRRADPLAAFGGAANIPSTAGFGRVSGSRERSTPARLDAVDLTAPARGGAVRDTMVQAVVLREVLTRVSRITWVDGAPQRRDEWERRVQRTPLVDEHGAPVMVAAGDQVGRASVASVLRLWARNWRDELWPGSRLPADDVPTTAAWLRDRLSEAIDRFAAIGDFAGEVRSLVGGLRAALGEYEPRPRPVLGVPCERCDARSQIVVLPDGYRECAGELGCGRLYSPQEWRDWMASETVGRMLPGGRPGRGERAR